ncbi:hypothetical protein EGT74_21745 [Chitinophaga lutea]|uniref:Uncharacterized protein n=1 Tax=Chitinophaga lutea TaxID=2488634 RepID=A0A3N4QCY0_9BACT|nr:hypothetical protein EGT74_21745 [Chitinophaga lutea]
MKDSLYVSCFPKRMDEIRGLNQIHERDEISRVIKLKTLLIAPLPGFPAKAFNLQQFTYTVY